MKPPARVVVGNLIWSADAGVWALWRVEPFAHAYTPAREKLTIHNRLRGLFLALPGESLLLSVCRRIDPWDVVADMLDDVDVDRHQAWAQVCDATARQLAGSALYRRIYYLAVQLDRPGPKGAWRDALRWAGEDVAAAFGLPPLAVSDTELEGRRSQARSLEARLGAHVTLTRVSAGEIRWLYARALRRGPHEPVLDAHWEPPARSPGGRHSVLAPLSDAVVKEGGYRDDPDRPRHRRYVRIDSGGVTSYQTFLAMADMPHEFTFPGGGGEWLHHLDQAFASIDWGVRLRAVPNLESQGKVRRQHRELIGQINEYDGEVTGAPPALAEAILATNRERDRLAANPSEPELQATMIFGIAAPDLTELEDWASALTALFEPQDYAVFRPTGGQVGLLRSLLPGARAAPVCRDYTQFLLPSDLAAGAPFTGPDVGDPRGLLLGVTIAGGDGAPVLLDPTYGPRVGRTASLAAVGALGSGKSFFLKRLCWDTLARGGQIVTIDRTPIGEYVAFAETVPGRAQVVRLASGSDVCLDPLRTFTGDQRAEVTLGFLSLLAGCSAHSEEGATLAEATDTVADRPGARLGDVVDELQRMGRDPERPDEAARSLARRLAHYRKLGVGRLAFGDGDPVSLDADCIVFWAPGLSLPERDTLIHEHLARQMLPEQTFGHALLYLVAAVGRQVVFRDPSRFGAALYDEAWALLASPHGERLLLEGIRDGRKHNGAIWLASQHPNDFGAGELVDLIGPRFVFRQSRGAIAAALRFLGAGGSDEAAQAIEDGLDTGQCLFRDVRDRIGLIQVLAPSVPGLSQAFDTTPNHDHRAGPLEPHIVADPGPDDAAVRGDPAGGREPAAAPTRHGHAPARSEPARSAADAGTRPRADAAPVRPAGEGTRRPRPDAAVPRGGSTKRRRALAAANARASARRRRRTPLADALDDKRDG